MLQYVKLSQIKVTVMKEHHYRLFSPETGNVGTDSNPSLPPCLLCCRPENQDFSVKSKTEPDQFATVTV